MKLAEFIDYIRNLHFEVEEEITLCLSTRTITFKVKKISEEII